MMKFKYEVRCFYVEKFIPQTERGKQIMGDFIEEGSLEKGISVFDESTNSYLFSVLIKGDDRMDGEDNTFSFFSDESEGLNLPYIIKSVGEDSLAELDLEAEEYMKMAEWTKNKSTFELELLKAFVNADYLGRMYAHMAPVMRMASIPEELEPESQEDADSMEEIEAIEEVKFIDESDISKEELFEMAVDGLDAIYEGNPHMFHSILSLISSATA